MRSVWKESFERVRWLVLFLVFQAYGHSQTWRIDPDFNLMVSAYSLTSSTTSQLLGGDSEGLDSLGGTFIGGDSTFINHQPNTGIIRLEPNGEVDSSFSFLGKLDLIVEVEPGKFWSIGGYLNEEGGIDRNLTFDADGNIDATVLPNLDRTLHLIQRVKTPSGYWYVIENLDDENNRMLRLTPDGALDQIIDMGDILEPVEAYADTVTDGAFVVKSGRIDGQTTRQLWIVNSDGTASQLEGDLGYITGGSSVHVFENGNVYWNRLQVSQFAGPDSRTVQLVIPQIDETTLRQTHKRFTWEGDHYAFGQFVGDSPSRYVIRVVDNNGIVAEQYEIIGLELRWKGIASIVAKRGNMLFFSDKGGLHRLELTNNSPSIIDREPDLQVTIQGSIASMDFDNNGNTIIAGHFNYINGHSTDHLARIDPNGEVDTSFKSRLSFQDPYVRSVKLSNSGEIYYLGCESLNRLDTEGNSVTVFTENEEGDPVVDFDFLPDGRIVLYLANRGNGGSISLFNTNTQLLTEIVSSLEFGQISFTSLSQAFKDNAYAVQASEDGSILVFGIFSSADGHFAPQILRITSNGILDTDYSPASILARDAHYWKFLFPSGKALSTHPFNNETYNPFGPFPVKANEPLFYDRREHLLESNGSLRPKFHLPRDFSFRILSAAELGDGRIVILRDQIDALSLYYPDGSEDPNMRNRLIIGDSEMRRIIGVDPQNRIYIANNSLNDRTCITVDNPPTPVGAFLRLEEIPSQGFTIQPQNRNLVAGDSIFLAAGLGAYDPNAEYEWYKDGLPIEGANNFNFILPFVSSQDSGQYHLQVTSNEGTLESAKATVVVTPSGSKLVNFSALGEVSESAIPPMGGFVINQGELANLLIRASGPSLPDREVEDVLLDPAINIFSNGEFLKSHAAENNTPELLEVETELGAYPFLLDTEETSATASLGPGVHAFQVFSPSSLSGIALLEAYDRNNDGNQAIFRNLSVRGTTDSEFRGLTLGFVITGQHPKTLLIRAVGQELQTQGSSNPIQNPQLAVYSKNDEGVFKFVDRNDDWDDEIGGTIKEQSTRIGAFPLEEDSGSAAIILQLPPGTHGVQAGQSFEPPRDILIELYDLE